MEREFVTYKIADKLRSLGFNETCLAYYDNYPNKILRPVEQDNDSFTSLEDIEKISVLLCKAPLWQQAIKFLMEKNLYITIGKTFNNEEDLVIYTPFINGESTWLEYHDYDMALEEGMEIAIKQLINNDTTTKKDY